MNCFFLSIANTLVCGVTFPLVVVVVVVVFIVIVVVVAAAVATDGAAAAAAAALGALLLSLLRFFLHLFCTRYQSENKITTKLLRNKIFH